MQQPSSPMNSSRHRGDSTAEWGSKTNAATNAMAAGGKCEGGRCVCGWFGGVKGEKEGGGSCDGQRRMSRLIHIPPRGFGADKSPKTNTAAEANENEDDGEVVDAFSDGLVAWERKRRVDLRRKSWLMDVAAAVD